MQLYEEYPSAYSADVARRHRWIRGDWQILSWLRETVPVSGKRRQKNPLSFLSQWKIFDNLRRSLVPAALTSLLIIGWTLMSPTWLWTSVVLAILLVPTIVASLLDLIRKSEDVLWEQHIRGVIEYQRKKLWTSDVQCGCPTLRATYES